MSSKVYFVNLRARTDKSNKISKIRNLFDRAGFNDLIQKDDLTAVKLHFGERGSDGFISPVFVRQVVDKIKENGANPFLTDTNTLYSGSRHNSVDHLLTALASMDPVAIDQASYDLVNKQLGLSNSFLSSNWETGADKFHGLRSHIDGTVQMRYGEEIGMGSRDYELIVL